MENELLIKQIADQRIKIEQLQNELLLKNKCLNLIAHDFSGVSRNLLWLIDALAEGTISLEIYNELYPEIKANILTNHKTIESTVAWVNTQRQTYIANYEVINTIDLFNQIRQFFVDSLNRKNIVLNYQGDEGINICTDLVLVNFILRALIDNAIKYSLSGSEIAFEVKTSLSGDQIIAIRDWGVGMSQQTLDKIFTLDGSPNTGTKQEKGAGLSLVIVDDFVKLIGAQLKVSSTETQGTQFELLIPESSQTMKK